MDTAAAARPARARLGTWPHEHDVVHLVLLDHQMVPTADDVGRWIDDARARGARAIRTGALFPPGVPAFLDAGFSTASVLTLLSRRLASDDHRQDAAHSRVRLRRLRPTMLHDAAEIDRRSFARSWSNDVAALGDIMSATPRHRSRCVVADRRMVAFSICGRADRTGYIQRVAVDPTARRRGLATALVADALQWMRRHELNVAMVNTDADNANALALYRSFGFEVEPTSLVILEREVATP